MNQTLFINALTVVSACSGVSNYYKTSPGIIIKQEKKIELMQSLITWAEKYDTPILKTHLFAHESSIISAINQNMSHNQKQVLNSTFFKNLPYKNIPTN